MGGALRLAPPSGHWSLVNDSYFMEVFMFNSSCCFTCGYFYGCHINPFGFVCGYCSCVSRLSDFGRCNLIIAPFHFSCEHYACFIGSFSDELPEYAPSDPLGSLDSEFFDNFSDSAFES